MEIAFQPSEASARSLKLDGGISVIGLCAAGLRESSANFQKKCALKPRKTGSKTTACEATYDLPPLNLSHREIFSFRLARKMLHAFEGTPLEMDTRSTLDKIDASLEGTFAVSLDALTEHRSAQAEDRVVIDPAVWEAMARAIEHRKICWPTTGGSTGREASTRLSPYPPTTSTGI